MCRRSTHLPGGHHQRPASHHTALACKTPALCPISQAAMLEEGVLERAARGVWGASSKPDRYSK